MDVMTHKRTRAAYHEVGAGGADGPWLHRPAHTGGVEPAGEPRGDLVEVLQGWRRETNLQRYTDISR